MLEQASKIFAVMLFSVYTFGFLITSLHTSTYGFTINNPLRPKILAAGAWFLVFLGIPAMIAANARRGVFAALDKKDWFSLWKWATDCYLLCILLGIGTALLFDFPQSAAPARFGRPEIIEGATWGLATIILLVLIHSKATSGWVRPAAILAYFLAPLYWSFSAADRLFRGEFDYMHVTIWFFAFCLWTLIEMRSKQWDWRHLATLCPIMLLIVAGFATYYYPRIKSSWGGGSPISVVLYLSKDAPVAPGKELPALLLDESDAGYYIVPAHESKAIFFPRSAVSLVLFGDKTSDSPLLRTATP